jgi:hypothetical protein
MRWWIAMSIVPALALVLYAADTERKGTVHGTVINEEGKPVKGAKVKAYPTDRGPGMALPSAFTDEAGHYTIRRLWWGKLWVYGMKEDEDYPDLGMGIYLGSRLVLPITLDSRHPSAKVNIRLGPKAGVLIGNVREAVTDVPLAPCVELRLVTEPDMYVTNSGWIQGKYRILVPSDRDVTMLIWDSEHRPWYYPGTEDKTNRTPLRLGPGEEKTLNIQLEPKNPAIKAHPASGVAGECPPIP